MVTRRRLLKCSAASGLVALLPSMAHTNEPLIRRAIPATGETLPVIGLGSWQTVREDNVVEARAVLERFHALGGRLVDTSPMYGAAEAVLGRIAAEAGIAPQLFMATKVWTDGEAAGVQQLAASRRLLGRTPLDLVQIHNLRDWRTHLGTLQAARERSELRTIGITHYTDQAHAALEAALRAERFDFVQLNYNILDDHAEQQLLPYAAERGVAVIVNRPFEEGALFDRVRGKPVPAWALEAGIASWGQFFLKWILSHPAVGCAIPATGKLKHLEDNLGAARGTLPDERLRARMRAHVLDL